MSTRRKPLSHGEKIDLPCGAKITVDSISRISDDRRSLVIVTIESQAGVPNGKVELGFYGSNIPMLIELLKRAYLTK